MLCRDMGKAKTRSKRFLVRQDRRVGHKGGGWVGGAGQKLEKPRGDRTRKVYACSLHS